VNKDKKVDQGSLANPPQDAEDAASKIGPYNPALGEIYQRLYPEILRPKPNQEAIAAALQAMQRLTMKMDSEIAVEETAKPSVVPSTACQACGHPNREGNRFCAMCGARVDSALTGSTAMKSQDPASSAPEATVEVLHQNSSVSEVEPIPSAQSHATDVGHQETPSAEATGQGTHHYHHHYHHHYFPGGNPEGASATSRVPAPETLRETDRLRIAAAAKGEPISRSEAAVRRLTQEWVLACNTRQLDELLDLYAPDAVVLRSNLPLLRGASQIREFFFSALESGLGEVALQPIRVELAGDCAHEVGRYSALVPGTSGKRREERGKYLWVFAKQNGGDWKLVSECWSSDLTLTSAESDAPKPTLSSASKGPVRKG
jgi:uncharacterized protein (TIGR02246 family)